MFFLPRLATLWGSPLASLPRWMRANALNEQFGSVHRDGLYPPNNYELLSYNDSTVAPCGFGPTWGALAGPYLANGVGLTPPDVLQQDSLLTRLFCTLWPTWNHACYHQEVLSYYRECAYPVMGVEDSIFRANGQAPDNIDSIENTVDGVWTAIPEAKTLYELIWRSTPAWMLSKKGLYLYGLDFVEDWAYSDPPSLKLPSPDDRVEDTDIWIQHPRTAQWLKIPDSAIDEDGVLDLIWESDTPLPRVRWQSVASRAQILAIGVIRINAIPFTGIRTQEVLFRTLEQIPLWNLVDELALIFNVNRNSNESNRAFWERLARQIGPFTGQNNRSIAMYASNQFDLLEVVTIPSSASSWATSGYYSLFPELPQRRSVTERLFYTTNNQEFRSMFEDPDPYACYRRGEHYIPGTASGGLVTITESIPASSFITASWLIPYWAPTETGVDLFPLNIPEGEYDLFIASSVGVQLYEGRRRNRRWTTYEEEEVPFDGIATFD